MTPYPSIKTGHIAVRSDFECSLEEAASFEFWEEKVKSKEAVFISNAFDIESVKTSSVEHITTTLKVMWELDPMPFEQMAMIDIYNGVLGFASTGIPERVRGYKCSLYALLPWRPNTPTTSAEQQIISEREVLPLADNVVLFGIPFNPNALDLQVTPTYYTYTHD